MQKLTIVEAMQLLAKSIGKSCMYVRFGDEDLLTEIDKAAPYMNLEDDNDQQIIFDGRGIIIFESEEMMEHAFSLTVGDDPAERNTYRGPARVYALTCNANGELLTENT